MSKTRKYMSIGSERTMGGTTSSDKGRGSYGRLRAGDEILGRYAVINVLGEGGMGVVYRCLDKVGGVEVAVKGLPPEVSHNADEMESIRANYQLVAGLRHSNIAGVRTLERDDGGDYYLVMDIADGENLNRWAHKHQNADSARKLAVLRQIAEALDYAHGEKIIHRDIKPENVVVDGSDRVKVLDFGLAAQIRSSQSRTSQMVTSTSGTPHYKAPEQWLGQPQGKASDLYSLAVVAFKLLFDRLPFETDDIAVLGQAVINAPVPEIDGASGQVNAAFAKGLAKKPQDRFDTCVQFVDALEGKSKLSAPGRWGENARVAGENLAAFARVVSAKMAKPLALLGKQLMWIVPACGVVALVWFGAKMLWRGKKTVVLPGGAKLELVWCPPGSFMMGSNNGEGDERPLHKVTFEKGFWIGRYEVTQAQWRSVMGRNPSKFTKKDNLPVEQVSWYDCEEFCKAAEDLGIRLPTEAEWEYACRAGTRGDYAGDLEKMAWYDETWMFGNTYAVGTKKSNAWGIYDMYGNVREWCQDWYDANYYANSPGRAPEGPESATGFRVVRGGGWNDDAKLCRSADRGWFKPGESDCRLGFRVVCPAGPND